jgi:hypothetical protein
MLLLMLRLMLMLMLMLMFALAEFLARDIRLALHRSYHGRRAK